MINIIDTFHDVHLWDQDALVGMTGWMFEGLENYREGGKPGKKQSEALG